MRLICQVGISNTNDTSHCKPSSASIAIGKKNKTDESIYLLISTARDKVGQIYKIKNNVETIFMKFIHEGKCTIRLKQPQLDISIRDADPLQLRVFTNFVKSGMKSNDFGNFITPIISASTSKNLNLQKRMSIDNQSDYPIKGKSFPKLLERLTVTNCELKRIDSRILNLYGLRMLHLGCNKISILPEMKLNPKSFSKLSELYLTSNKLTAIAPEFISALQDTLSLIDLNNNEISVLPDNICEMKRLQILRCSYNKLTTLPRNIGFLPNLRDLNVSNNKLLYLPGSLRKLRLRCLITHNNNFVVFKTVKNANFSLPVSSLKEISARVITKKKLKYSNDVLPPFLRNYLAAVTWSSCGQPCFDNFITLLGGYNLSRAADELIGDEKLIPLENIVCCQKCLRYSAFA